ncbi:MAG TPA: hypothetical protein VFQ61_29920 [Polyangiaceae bacterium]|nr:hypothetical protein [Polyangiaceae bacterium]
MSPPVLSRGHRALLACLVACGLSGVGSRAFAQAAKPAPPREHEVKFQARHVEVDGDGESLRLSGDVVVRAERFQITSSDIRLSRSRRGLHVVGQGKLSFCPCPEPPVTLGFASADFAPPTDILLYGGTLRLLGLPLFWSPFLWLRAADRVGLLPPNFAYRGEEGFVFGSGFHLPLGPLGRNPSRFDLRAWGYSRGGFGSSIEVQTESGFSRVGWDYLERANSLDISSQWAARSESGAVWAERVEVLRGTRAQIAPATLERVALPKDRVRLAVGSAGQHGFAVTLEADARRGRALDDFGAQGGAWMGPGFTLGLGTSLGKSAQLGFHAETRSAWAANGALAVGNLGWGASVSVPIAALLWDIELRQRLSWAANETDAASASRSALRSRLGLPLLRRSESSTTWLEPYAELSTLVARLEEPIWFAADLRSGFFASAITGAKIAFSQAGAGARRALEWSLGAGGAVRGKSELTPLLASELSAAWGSVRASGLLAGDPKTRALETSVRAELGEVDGPRLGLRLDARNSARVLLSTLESDLALWGRSLSMQGTSLRARLGSPLLLGFAASVGSDFDLDTRRALASAAELAYRHRCKCVSFHLGGSRREGRRGFDVNVGLELFPR